MRLLLLFPDWALSPNSRSDRRSLTSIRQDAWLAGETCARKALEYSDPLNPDGIFRAEWFFMEPNNNVKDEDNIKGALKATLDGVCKVLGINDNQIVMSRQRKLGVKKPGAVMLVLNELDKGEWAAEKKLYTHWLEVLQERDR